MSAHFRTLFAHAQWADERAMQSIVESEHLPARALELMGHLLAAGQVWMARIHGVSPRVALHNTLSIAECDALMRENHAAYAEYMQTLTDAELARGVTYRNTAGQEYTSTVAEILTQVSLHACYHRGQIAALVRAAGDTPQPTDFIVFARSGPGAARQGGHP